MDASGGVDSEKIAGRAPEIVAFPQEFGSDKGMNERTVRSLSSRNRARRRTQGAYAVEGDVEIVVDGDFEFLSSSSATTAILTTTSYKISP